jgi:hypothetical protein
MTVSLEGESVRSDGASRNQSGHMVCCFQLLVGLYRAKWYGIDFWKSNGR